MSKSYTSAIGYRPVPLAAAPSVMVCSCSLLATASTSASPFSFGGSSPPPAT